MTFRIGVDENGLGARLGPLVVTAVMARVTEQGTRLLSRKPPKRLRGDLGDSKTLVSHGDVGLGEAWARALVLGSTPAEIFERLSLEGSSKLKEPCPKHVESQCWSSGRETFVSTVPDVARLSKHLAWWAERGVEIVATRSSVVCTKRLNDDKQAGKNRFVSDLHAMEHLILDLRGVVDGDVTAVCGKVGGMDDYSKFFGPLSYRLHSVLECGKALSAYHFPGLGEVRFVRDADATDSLVMLASIVGKYVRELLMARVATYYHAGDPDAESVSGYHDPVTARFVAATSIVRKERQVPDHCFERARDLV